MEVTVSGKKVKLYDKLEARRNWDVMQKWQKLDPNNFDDVAGFMARLVESWEFPGDPADVESYAKLDLFTEFTPICDAVFQLMKPKFEASEGNLQKPPTSA